MNAPEPLLPLTVVIATRFKHAQVEHVLDAIWPQIDAVGGEVVVVSGAGEMVATPRGVRWLGVDTDNLLLLRSIGVRSARGTIVAMAEDHSVPRPDWSKAVLRAHAEHPGALALSGCLMNGTDRRTAARTNFLSFGSPFMAPLPSEPPHRPPPISVVSFKRAAIVDLDDEPGTLEAIVLPRLFTAGQIVADERIVVDHYQDVTFRWAIRNAFCGGRATYGYARARLDARGRREVVRWVVKHVHSNTWREARSRVGSGPRAWRDLAMIGLLGVATAGGGVVGTLAGPGRSPSVMA